MLHELFTKFAKILWNNCAKDYKECRNKFQKIRKNNVCNSMHMYISLLNYNHHICIFLVSFWHSFDASIDSISWTESCILYRCKNTYNFSHLIMWNMIWLFYKDIFAMSFINGNEVRTFLKTVFLVNLLFL